jgi:hypothetical protein
VPGGRRGGGGEGHDPIARAFGPARIIFIFWANHLYRAINKPSRATTEEDRPPISRDILTFISMDEMATERVARRVLRYGFNLFEGSERRCHRYPHRQHQWSMPLSDFQYPLPYHNIGSFLFRRISATIQFEVGALHCRRLGCLKFLVSILASFNNGYTTPSSSFRKSVAII